MESTAVSARRILLRRVLRYTRRLQWRRLIDEHYGDIVANWVTKPARVAEEALFRRAVLESAFALRTDQDLQQLRCKRHVSCSLGTT